MNGSDIGNILIPVPGELQSAVDDITVSADGVYDYMLEEDQETINKRLSDDISDIKNAMLDSEYADIKAECKASKSAYYKYIQTADITITGSTNAAAGDVSKIYIMDGDNDNVIENLANQTNSNNVQYTFSPENTNQTFKCIAQYGSKYGNKSKVSSVITVSARNPIFYGASEDIDLQNFSSSEIGTFVDSNAIADHLYSAGAPADTISGKTIKITLEDSSRLWVLTTNSKLGAKDGGFDFPLFRYAAMYEGIHYYLYVSQGTYSNGEHVLVFNSDENYS